MKKLLAMVLALVMTLSLAVSANALKADEKINDNYAEAVAVLDGMGVFKGYEDGSFKPENKITRAEVATIIYRIYTQDLAKNDKSGLYASYNKFSDMAGAGWAAGYIGYCANAEFVKGYPDGTFKPSGNVTGYEVLTMILRAIGYDKNGEFTGADWALNVAKYAEQAGVLANVKGVDLNAPATRELVAELLFRAIAKAPMVTYTAAFGYQTVSFSGSKNDSKLFKDNETLGHKNFDLTPNATNGTYGRPATKWTYNCGDKSTTVYDKPVATYTEKVSACDLCKDLSEKKEAKVVLSYTDGVKSTTAVTYKANDTKTETGAQGQLTEVYENGDDYTVIYINTYLAKVTKVIEEVKDKNDHVKVEASVNVDVYGTKANNAGDVTNEVITDNFETDGFKKGDFVLVTYDNGDIASMEAAKGEVAKLTGLKGKSEETSDIKAVTAVAYNNVKVAVMATMNPLAKGKDAVINLKDSYTFYYDTYGNIIGVGDYTADANYVVIDRIWAGHDDGKVTVYADLVNVSDASVLTKVTVKSVEGVKVTANVDQEAKQNKEFYEDLMTYTVNKDGEYELTDTGVKVETKIQDKTTKLLCTYDANEKKDVINTPTGYKNVYMDKDTEILFQYTASPEGTYKAYTLDTLPNSFWGYVEYVVGENGRADVVYVRGADKTFSYIFVTDINDIETKQVDDDTTKYILGSAYALNEDGKLDEKSAVSVTSDSKNFVLNANAVVGSTQSLTTLSKAGLYKLYTLGENDQVLQYVEPTKLTEVKDFKDNTVLGLYEDELVNADELQKFYWTGDFENTDGENSPYAVELEKADDKSELTSMEAGNWVYVQRDAKDEEIVALHKISLKVAVSVSDKENASVTADTMYFGDALKDLEVTVKAWNEATGVKMNGVAAADYTLAQKDEKLTHSSERVYTAKAAKNAVVDGDIVVTIAAEPACNSKEIRAVDPLPADITNFSVEVTPHTNSVRGTVKVIAPSAATVKVNDLLRCIKANGTHVNPDLVVFDNSLENKITDTNVTLDKVGNVAIAVYAEDGSVAYYNVVVAEH
ncbi:S-layer homology domain-containing protein [Oscillibacter sp. ER4]|uniref:S-layer homology domain-containing protein n=1 Tax=Oscillibacter sp. ER4 TaxID=1519439 RepID=UPI0009DDA63C|nr:S-layer homology domain-containing protein [Oscillibacter sp. ER4]